MENKCHTFDCGCSFPIVTNNQKERLCWQPDYNTINLDCNKTWDLICQGNTKGCFQLENQQRIAAQVKPRNINELSDLIAIIRPGTLEAKIGRKTLTQHYIDRKNGKEQIDYFHPALEPILKDTYGIMCYQESSLKIAQDIAGFSPEESDSLRKSIGKKDTKIMASMKDKFLQGCIKIGKVNQKEAEEIFSWIEKSQRYSFCKAHAISYSFNAYMSAYAKAHFPQTFYTSWLYWARKKINPHQEIQELIDDAKINNVIIKPPDIRIMNKHFKIVESIIYFGLADIKGIGRHVFDQLYTIIKQEESIHKKTISQFSWLEFLVYISDKINKTVIESLISTGALSYMLTDRIKMLYEYNLYSKLTKKEKLYLYTNYTPNHNNSLTALLDIIISQGSGRKKAISNKNRLSMIQNILDSLKNPPYNLTDNNIWISEIERSLLGIPITCAGVNAITAQQANCTCKEALSLHSKKLLLLAGKIESITPVKTKNGKHIGQKMAFIKLRDDSCAVDCVVFPEVYNECKAILQPAKSVLINGYRQEQSIIVKKLWETS